MLYWFRSQDIIAEDEDAHGAMLVPIISGSDKTTVSVATGHQEYHPVCGHLESSQIQLDVRMEMQSFQLNSFLYQKVRRNFFVFTYIINLIPYCSQQTPTKGLWISELRPADVPHVPGAGTPSARCTSSANSRMVNSSPLPRLTGRVSGEFMSAIRPSTRSWMYWNERICVPSP